MGRERGTRQWNVRGLAEVGRSSRHMYGGDAAQRSRDEAGANEDSRSNKDRNTRKGRKEND